MEIIKLSNKKHIKAITDCFESVNDAKAGVSEMSSQLRYRNDVLFKLIKDLYPKTKGYHCRFNSEKNEITKLFKEESDN